MIRLPLPLAEPSDWHELFCAERSELLVPTGNPPSIGTPVHVDMTIGPDGPRVILRGTVVPLAAPLDADSRQGCTVRIAVIDQVKVGFVKAFVRGGLINRREQRRLPLCLPVTFNDSDGPKRAFTRDINDEGVFVVCDFPFAKGTKLPIAISFPNRAEPVVFEGIVGHTILMHDEDVPGMGILFVLDEDHARGLTEILDDLELAFYRGTLPDAVIT